MQERIYINGVLMEQSDTKGISLVYQSQLFTDIDSIVSNRTNSVDFPMTRNNLLAIDRTHLPGIDSPYAYRRHRVIYIRDGIQIFTGYGTLLSITDTAIKVSFTWGYVEAVKKLLDIRLRDLTHPDMYGYVTWSNDTYGVGEEYYDRSIRFGATAIPHPIMPVARIIEAMEKASGVKIKNPEVFSNYVIPLVSKHADDETRRESMVGIYAGGIYEYRMGPEILPTWGFSCLVPDGDEDFDRTGMYVGNGIYNVSDLENISLFIAANGLEYRVRYKIDVQLRKTMYTDVEIYSVTETGGNPKLLATLPTKEYDRDDEYIWLRVAEDTEVSVNVSECTHIIISLNTCPNTDSLRFQEVGFGDYLHVRLFSPDLEEVQPGTPFPLWKNLPDWDCAQLLKNLMKIAGVFPFLGDSENEIEFIGADRIYGNRSKAPDWTDKLVFKNGLPTEQAMQYGSYARINHCKYAEDDTVQGNYDGDLVIDSETLDGEADLIELDFAPTRCAGQDGKTPYIDAYKQNEDGEIEFTEVEPRILQYYTDNEGNKRTTFIGLEWQALLEDKYYTYRQLVNRPRVIKASVVLDALELSKLDLSIPVYSFSLGHYYAITKLTTKEDGLAEVEMLMLHDTIREQAEVDSITDLAVLSDGNGGHYATVLTMTREQISALRQNPDYRICLIRYGYARRGKFAKYTDKIGRETDTNTDRKKYRNYRKGQKWRIIGEELLVTGKIATHSQTHRYYGSSSLVFALNDTITLPPMRRKTRGGKSRNLTKDGRIRNPERDGIAELSIALYKRDAEGKWKRISNIVPVRGRSEDRRSLWEFSTGNIVEVE